MPSMTFPPYVHIFSYGYGSIPINSIFNGMNIHKSQLFWGSLGTRVLTHPHIFSKAFCWLRLLPSKFQMTSNDQLIAIGIILPGLLGIMITHSRETYQPTSIMRWDSGIFNGSYIFISFPRHFVDWDSCPPNFMWPSLTSPLTSISPESHLWSPNLGSICCHLMQIW